MAVADVPDTGRQVELVADAATRDAVAKAVGVAALPRLSASFEMTRQGSDGLRVVGRVMAGVTQNCVVTLEPIESEVDEVVDLVFAPQPQAAPDKGSASFNADAGEPPEALDNGVVDLGALATEFLILGIDPYPRKPGAVFEPPAADDPSSHPFAALAALKKDGTAEGR